MAEHDGPLQEMSDERARELLASQSLGRVVARVHDILEIFPVNYGFDGERVVLRTAPGTKLAGMVAANEMLFETDSVTAEHAWSVVGRGSARLVETDAERAELAQALPTTLLPTAKDVVVVFDFTELTGREFTPGDEPETEPETVA